MNRRVKFLYRKIKTQDTLIDDSIKEGLKLSILRFLEIPTSRSPLRGPK